MTLATEIQISKTTKLIPEKLSKEVKTKKASSCQWVEALENDLSRSVSESIFN